MKIHKKIFMNILSACAAITVISATSASAQQAVSLDELLQMLKDNKIAESKEHQQREAEFRKDRANQARLLQQAQNTKAGEEARSTALEKTYKEQELLVEDKREQLDERLGSLKELFGHLTSTAGDLRSNIENSIVSAQYPDREVFLDDLIDKMNSETKLPSIEEIERLWYELQRETIEASRITKFPATVSDPSGNTAERDVVRIGNYNLVADGKYLQYNPSTGNVAELPRQPQARFTSTASAIFGAGGGQVEGFGVDPTRGQILSLLTEKPNLKERIQQGGLVGYIIIGVGILGLLIALERLVTLGLVSGKVSSQLKSDQINTNNPLGRVLKVGEDNKGADSESLELKLGEAILKETPPLTRSLTFLKIISVVAPLMGLLGTVTGMINTFQAITLFGTGDPKLMAGGISQALMTTVLGLCVAIPTVLLHTIVSGRSSRIIHVLQEQAAGIIAERSERSA